MRNLQCDVISVLNDNKKMIDLSVSIEIIADANADAQFE